MNAAPAGSASVSAALAQIAEVKRPLRSAARRCSGFHIGRVFRESNGKVALPSAALRMTCRLAKMCGAFVPQRLQARSLERRANIGSTNGATCSQAARHCPGCDGHRTCGPGSVYRSGNQSAGFDLARLIDSANSVPSA